MKTAILKTDFWKQDRIFELLPDARYYYLCLMTNPDRNGTRALKCSDRLMSAYTGYNNDTVQLCKKELVDKGFVQIVDGYYILDNQDYIKPTSGKLTALLYKKDFNSLPDNIKELLLSGTGVAQECIGISISKGISKGNSINKVEVKPINERAVTLASLLASMIMENFPFVKRVSPSEWSKDIEMINRIDGHPYELIEFIILWSQQDSFWKKNIRSGDKLRKQFTSLMVQAKCDSDKNQRKVVRV